MKVGILSMQRVINYGSFLQAYALKNLIESLGHEAYFVDVKKGRQLGSVVKSNSHGQADISLKIRGDRHEISKDKCKRCEWDCPFGSSVPGSVKNI